ncbi:hypothetical protein D3C71_1998130 [compost metagenome]
MTRYAMAEPFLSLPKAAVLVPRPDSAALHRCYPVVLSIRQAERKRQDSSNQ